jgi:hypothetical protein
VLPQEHHGEREETVEERREGGRGCHTMRSSTAGGEIYLCRGPGFRVRVLLRNNVNETTPKKN